MGGVQSWKIHFRPLRNCINSILCTFIVAGRFSNTGEISTNVFIRAENYYANLRKRSARVQGPLHLRIIIIIFNFAYLYECARSESHIYKSLIFKTRKIDYSTNVTEIKIFSALAIARTLVMAAINIIGKNILLGRSAPRNPSYDIINT